MASLVMPATSQSSRTQRPCSPQRFSTLLNLDASSDLKRFSGCLGPSRAQFSEPLPLNINQSAPWPHQSYRGQQLPPVAALQRFSSSDASGPAQQLQLQQTQNQQQLRPAPSSSRVPVPSAAMNMQQGSSNASVTRNTVQHTRPQYGPQGPNASWAPAQMASQLPTPQSSLMASPAPARCATHTADDPNTWPAAIRTLIERARRWGAPATPSVVYLVRAQIYSPYLENTNDVVATCSTLHDANMAAVEYFITEYWGGKDYGDEPPTYELKEDGRLDIHVECDDQLEANIYVTKSKVRSRG